MFNTGDWHVSDGRLKWVNPALASYPIAAATELQSGIGIHSFLKQLHRDSVVLNI